MDEQPVTIAQIFARAKASILDANDETQDNKQREKMRRAVFDSLELAELRIRSKLTAKSEVW